MKRVPYSYLFLAFRRNIGGTLYHYLMLHWHSLISLWCTSNRSDELVLNIFPRIQTDDSLPLMKWTGDDITWKKIDLKKSTLKQRTVLLYYQDELIFGSSLTVPQIHLRKYLQRDLPYCDIFGSDYCSWKILRDNVYTTQSDLNIVEL